MHQKPSVFSRRYSQKLRQNSHSHGAEDQVRGDMETPVKSVCWKRVSAMKKKGGVNNVRPQKQDLRFVIYNSTYQLKKSGISEKKNGKKRKKPLCGFLEEVLPWNWDQSGLIETAKTNLPVWGHRAGRRLLEWIEEDEVGASMPKTFSPDKGKPAKGVE